MKDTMLRVRVTLQPEHSDRLLLRVDNPILGNPCLSIVGALDLRITIGVIWANDFDNEIGAKPVAILSARIVRVAQSSSYRAFVKASPPSPLYVSRTTTASLNRANGAT